MCVHLEVTHNIGLTFIVLLCIKLINTLLLLSVLIFDKDDYNQFHTTASQLQNFFVHPGVDYVKVSAVVTWGGFFIDYLLCE